MSTSWLCCCHLGVGSNSHGCPLRGPWTHCGELPLKTMVLPFLLKILDVVLPQSTLTKAATSNWCCHRPSCCCPAALMPPPPGLLLSCHHGWEAREHPQRLPAEGRKVRGQEQRFEQEMHLWYDVYIKSFLCHWLYTVVDNIFITP